MDRRSFLKTTGAVAGSAATGLPLATDSIAAPNLGRGALELRIGARIPEAMPVIGELPRRLADRVARLSDGRIRLVGAEGPDTDAVLDVAGAVTTDPALAVIGGVPCGLSGPAIESWLIAGGGQALWENVAARHGVKPFHAGRGGGPRALWTRAPLTTFAGTTFAARGIAGMALSELGARVAPRPADEIASALAAGSIDGAEGFAPLIDLTLGLIEAAPHGHAGPLFIAETVFALEFDLGMWDRLSETDRALIEAAIAAEAGRIGPELAAHAEMALATARVRHGAAISQASEGPWRDAPVAVDEVLSRIERASSAGARLMASYRGFARLTLPALPGAARPVA